MVQFNLLPDVKLEYVKIQRTKHFLTLISLIVSAASLVLLAISFVTVDVVQKKMLNDANSDVKKYSTQLKSTPNLNKMLTVQNQLSTLSSLHSEKPVTSRLFAYIAQVSPSLANLSQLGIDFSQGTITISGSAPSLDVVSTYTDTLKATTYSTSGSANTHAFKNVVLASFGRNQDGATFTITFGFDPTIFDSSQTIKLTVPQDAGSDQSNVFQEGQ